MSHKWPVVLAVTTTHQLEVLRPWVPDHFEIVMGREVFADRDLLHSITNVRRVAGVPVLFPEEPAIPDWCITLHAVNGEGDRVLHSWIAVESLWDCSLVEV